MSRTTGVLVFAYIRNPEIFPLFANFKISAFIKSHQKLNCCDFSVKNIPFIAVLCSQIGSYDVLCVAAS